MAVCIVPPPSIPLLSSTLIQVASFVIYVFIIPALTAHTPIPLSFEDAVGRTVSTILSPISSSVTSLEACVMFIMKIVGNSRFWGGAARTPLHDGISAGAIAIRIPIRFVPILCEDTFGWRKLNDNIPTDESQSQQLSGETVLYSLPWNCRIRTTQSLMLYPVSSKFKSTIAILQLSYSTFQVYIQYEPLVRCQGLSSPFLITIPHLYMSCVNLMANLVQGSYTHVAVLPCASPIITTIPTSQPAPSEPLTISPPPQALLKSIRPQPVSPADSQLTYANTHHLALSSTRQQGKRDLQRRFDIWLSTNFPHLEFHHHSSSFSIIAFFTHHSLALIIILFWLTILTTFNTGRFPSQVFIVLGIVMDPLVHIVLAVMQSRWSSFGAIVVAKVGVWGFNLIACLFALQILAESHGAVEP